MAYDPKAREGLTEIHGNKDANTYADIFGGPGNLLGFGNTAWNNEIERKNAKLAELKAQLGEERFNTIKNAVDANGGDWSQLGIDIFGDDGDKLDQQYAGVEASDQGNLKDLLGELGNYKNSADFFKDPNFMGYVGDVEGYKGPSSATLGAQKDALQQYKNLSNPTETAQEKLVRMMAQRQMENNLAGDRDALARSLKSRGVYGSGAEVTGNMMAQGQEADRAALANMQANAQASQRAMQALGSYSSLASGMRGQEDQEGSIANQVAEWNNQIHQGQVMQRGGAQVAATQAGEAAKGQRAVQGFTGASNVNNAVRQDIPAVNNAKTGYVTGNTGQRMQGAGAMSDVLGGEMAEIDKDRTMNEAKKKSGFLS